jgi:plasmid stabilization system protein ParE
MRVRAALSVIRRMDAEVDYSLQGFGVRAADKLEDRLLEVLEKLKKRLLGHRFSDELPDCYRVNVKPLVLLYYRNELQGYILVYSICGGRQRPMAPRVHNALITKAERNSIEL